MKGKEATHIFFEEAGSFKALSGLEYYKEMMGTGNYEGIYTETQIKFPSLWFERGVYDLTGTKKLFSNATEYQKYYRRIEDLEPEEQVYLSEGRMLTMEGPRRSGRSYRIIDNAIDKLIKDGRTIVMDHHPRGHDHTWREFKRRLMSEHPEIEFEFEFNKPDRPKIIFITNA